jgi:hypothetical protein
MLRSPDLPQATSRSSFLAVAILIAAGYGLTLLVFYPGIMTYDAKFAYEDIAKHTLGDWQSPAMTVLWALIDPIAPGSASMFLLIVSSYWLSFGLLALTLARRSGLLAVFVLILALTPPAFAFVGVIWRDVLFATTWLLAAVISYAVASWRRTLRVPGQLLAIMLCAFGVLLRPNALIAAPILGAYIAWPMQFNWKRTAVLFVPAAVLFFLLVQLIYYGVLGATRQHPLQSIMVFDLGGISHFTEENQFPVNWSPSESALLLHGCYRPTEWDIYWRIAPCEFVMHKLEKDEKLFGTRAIENAWAYAVIHHPVAYLEHRAGFMWNFLTGANLTMWVADVERPETEVFLDRPAFVILKRIHDALKATPLFRVGTWLLASIAVCGLAWRRRQTAEGAFAIGLCGTAAVYVATFFAVGVAPDFRYGYFAVLGTIAGGATLLAPMRRSM